MAPAPAGPSVPAMIVMRELSNLDVAHRRVLVRADLNVPLGEEDGAVVVADDTRIRAALPTIEELRRRHARIVLASHLGRPHGRDPGLSMRPVAERLNELLGGGVSLAPDVVGGEVSALTRRLSPGEVLLLENLRFEPGEKQNDPEFALALADLADAYVDDAFGTAHRAHASTEGVARLLPGAAGLLMEREVRALSELTDSPERPLVAVLGGAKVADKVVLVERFVELADTVLIGGAMSFPFLLAQGHAVGAYACSDEDLEAARRALARARDRGRELSLPSDLVVAERIAPDAAARIVGTPDVPPGLLGLDIGPDTAARYAERIAGAATVFWNGPMGAFECEPFASGTRTVAEAIAGSAATSVVGGGETVEAVRRLGLDRAIDHVSTGGGATLRLLQGATLPAVEALRVDRDTVAAPAAAPAGSHA